MGSLAQTMDAGLRRLIGNCCYGKVALAINAAAAATIKNTGVITYSINGIGYSKAALAAQSFAVTHGDDGKAVGIGFPAYTQPVNTVVFYVVSLDAAGNVAVSQGSYAGQSLVPVGGNVFAGYTGSGKLPSEPDNFTAIGVIKIATGAAATFTPGTTALDAAGITATYYDVTVLPASL